MANVVYNMVKGKVGFGLRMETVHKELVNKKCLGINYRVKLGATVSTQVLNTRN